MIIRTVNRLVPSREGTKKRGRERERCRIFSLEFFLEMGIWAEGSHENPRGGFVKSSHCRWRDNGGRAPTVTICTQTDRRASLSHWFDRSSSGSIRLGFLRFERNERERGRGRERRAGVVVARIRRRRWGELMLGGRCISVITEWPDTRPPPRVPDTRLPFSNMPKISHHDPSSPQFSFDRESSLENFDDPLI